MTTQQYQKASEHFISCVPTSPNLSLRPKRGNLIAGESVAQATGLPRRYAPRDDKLGTRELSIVIARSGSDVAISSHLCSRNEIATLRSQ